MGPKRSRLAPISHCFALLSLAFVGCGEQGAGPRGGAAGEIVVLKENGGYCWFQDPRAIVDRGKIIVGSVAGWTEHGSLAGDIDVTTFELDTRATTTFALHPELDGDDHDAPSILALPDGRYLAMYTKHAADFMMRYRLSLSPGDATSWGAEQEIEIPGAGGVTYSNTFTLSAEGGRVYAFYRARGHQPWVMTADREAKAFELRGRLLAWDKSEALGADPAKLTGHMGRTGPYQRYASSGVDAIHFVTTEDHPVAYDNSLYHGVVRGGAVWDSFGGLVDANLFDEDAKSPVALTRVFEGDIDHVAWPVDLELDRDGRPVVVFSVQRGGAATRGTELDGGGDHRFYHGRFDGERWHVHEMAHAGARLYAGQEDYTGLAAIDPGDVDTVFLSTNADPVTGAPLVSVADGRRHHEIYRARTSDGGATWAFTPITQGSTTDNLRPIVPRWEGHTALLWLRGTYFNMRHYRQDVVAIIDP